MDHKNNSFNHRWLLLMPRAVNEILVRHQLLEWLKIILVNVAYKL